METKRIELDSIELKVKGKPGFFSGYASKFNGVDAYGDMILPGAYADTLKNRTRPIGMRWNHFGPIIGKWVDITEDANGLYVEGELTPKHSVAEDVYASLQHGSVDGMSIGYRIPPGGSQKEGKLRKLKRIDLVEISVVEQPADMGARVEDVKSIIQECQTLKEIEGLLCDTAGFSRKDAELLISRIKSIDCGDRGLKTSAEIAEVIGKFKFNSLGVQK